MSDPARPHVRILPEGVERTDDVPIPDQSIEPDERPERPERLVPPEPDTDETSITHFDTIEINDEEPDTGPLLDKIIDRRSWHAGAYVGDGTPGPGRTPFSIDERIVYAMALVGGTMAEIAAHFGCSDTVIGKRFGTLVRQARASRHIRLRQRQYQKAMEGDTGMLIWLGKQELGQVDESRLRLGDLSRFSDEELAQIAQGKIPGQLNSGKPAEEEK